MASCDGLSSTTTRFYLSLSWSCCLSRHFFDFPRVLEGGGEGGAWALNVAVVVGSGRKDDYPVVQGNLIARQNFAGPSSSRGAILSVIGRPGMSSSADFSSDYGGETLKALLHHEALAFDKHFPRQ